MLDHDRWKEEQQRKRSFSLDNLNSKKSLEPEKNAIFIKELYILYVT